MDGLKYAFDLHWLLAAVLALVLTYIPLVGSLTGVYGAINAWDWPWLQACLLFFWYVPVLALIYLFAGISALLDRN